MADQKLTALTAETVVEDADLLYIVTDVSTTATSKKVTIATLKAGVVADLLEEEIDGTALYNATMTGTVNLDLSTFTAYRGILTGNTTITVTNTPASGKSFVRSFTIQSSATESLTLPAAWKIVNGTYTADGTVNDIQIEFSNFPTTGLLVKVYFNDVS